MVEAEVHRRVLATPVEELREANLDERVSSEVRELAPLLSSDDHQAIVTSVLARLTGLGPIERLLRTDGVTDVMINGPGPVWIERDGQMESVDIVLSLDEIDHLVERMIAPSGRRLDRTSPLVDGRLPDGSRVHVAAPPVSVGGPYVTIRRFQVHHLELADVATPGVAALLRWAVQARSNLLISGGTGSGKTTLLNALAGFVDPGERMVTIEDAAELDLAARHVARLEARPPMVDGPPPISIRDLVRNALRMRPDRIIVGEVRGAEALDMLQAMNTGHDGSLSTIHANGPSDALRRLESMVLMGSTLSQTLVCELTSAAVDLVVHLERRADGRRRIAAVAEPVGGVAHDVRLLGTADSGLLKLPARPPRRSGPLVGIDVPELLG